jgi:hypothetical protein
MLKTKFFKNPLAILLVGIISLFQIGCDDNDEIAVDPNAAFDAVLDVKEAGPANPNVDVAVNANTSSTILAKVTFTSTTKDMRRLYITQNIKGAGETAYKPTENIDLKADGAVDLAAALQKSFEFQFELPVPAGVGTGTVVYKFWTTTGNGDFRDLTQRLAVGAGTITLKYGTATNPAAGEANVVSYPTVKLVAPLADGTSKTFVSLTNGLTYNVSSGIEYVSLWDFGYLFSITADAATLRAPFNYPTIAIDIPTKASTTNDELNKTYFKKSTKTTAEFDAVTKAADLDFITIINADANLVVTQLAVGSVVEFIDQYGNKGMLKVTALTAGNGSDGSITFAIKVQP